MRYGTRADSMATPASSEASEIRRRGRQRLIGAFALVILLVVFVPMVLDSEPRPSRPQPAIPPRQGAAALPAPLPATPAPAPAAKTPTAPAGAVTPPAAAAAKVQAVPAEAPEVKASSPRLAGFAVQVGAFRDEAKLKQARDKLAGASIPHYTERLESPGGPLTRLRAGPFATREAAEGAQVALRRAALDGKVVALP